MILEGSLPFQLRIDWSMLKAQKNVIILLAARAHAEGSKEDEDALEGILSLLDELGDQAVDTHGLDVHEVFDLREDEELAATGPPAPPARRIRRDI